MQFWQRLEPSGHLFHDGVVTIGNFDGIHIGHQTLLRQAVRLGHPVAVITFAPHPMQVLQPERRLLSLFPREDLAEQLPAYGIDLLAVLPFDQALARLLAADFLQQYVLEPLRPKHIVAGYDFAFGKGREGTLEVLGPWCRTQEIELHVVPALRVGGQIVGTRHIRNLVERGEVRAVSALLGREFYLRGPVVEGAGRGAKILVPTLNQKVVNETLPLSGVYASRVICDGIGYMSVTNIGTNPTFTSGDRLKVETHVIGQRVEFGAGKMIDVRLVQRLRAERKFTNAAELHTQIHADIAAAKLIHSDSTP